MSKVDNVSSVKFVSVDEKVKRGELKLEEVEILRLQKLFYRADSCAKLFLLVQQELDKVKENAEGSNEDLNKYISVLKRKYNLKDYHGFDMSESEKAGLVVFSRQPHE